MHGGYVNTLGAEYSPPAFYPGDQIVPKNFSPFLDALFRRKLTRRRKLWLFVRLLVTRGRWHWPKDSYTHVFTRSPS